MKILAINNKDEQIRRKSSSGGVFYILANQVVALGGVVFGAKFDEDFQVVHGYTETAEGIEAFMQSKYVQSDVGTAYKDAEKFLKEGREVLFSGTPCQISALRKYLQKDYENLITVDFICHGVPSRRIWREYIDEMSKKKEIVSVNFRDKTQGWRVFSLKIDYADGSTYRKNLEEDIFVSGFLKNLYLRPSCYECSFRGFDRVSDITLADFWGVQREYPELFDDKGTSLVLIRSDKVYDMIMSQSENLVYKDIPEEVVRRTNSAVEKSCKPHPKRKEFFDTEYKSVRKAVGKIVADPITIRIKKKLYKLIRG